MQSDECKLLFPVFRLEAGESSSGRKTRNCLLFFFLFFVFLHRSWFRWKALVSEHHLTMLILMHMLLFCFFFPSPVASPHRALFFTDENTAKGKKKEERKNPAGSYYNILKICSFCFRVLIRYGRSYYLSVPFREKYYLTLLSVWVTFNTLA